MTMVLWTPGDFFFFFLIKGGPILVLFVLISTFFIQIHLDRNVVK